MLLPSDEDGGGKSENEKEDKLDGENWGKMIMMLKRVGSFSMSEIKEMPYPFFKSILGYIYDEDTYPIARPYMGSSKDEEDEEEQPTLDKPEDVAAILARMNAEWGN